ncbi:tyrosine-type recombinase/integrase [Paraburkholderia sp. EG286B]|uniref:tyrosine-type recombinase/integrase n=1 Tax=Paraburkholderia sp. EG286B TaxID=3237011 RepID=UPI0034D1C8FF
MKMAPLAYWLHAFFHEWLAEQRNCSRHTILSYRDTWRLYLRFVAARRHCPVSSINLSELTADEVLAFLKYIESERHTSIGTRNCRLAALHSFYRFIADREPLAAMQCAAVLRIPAKRGPIAEPAYLDIEEVEAILRQPDCSTPEGQRDYTLLAFLYNTGARIQEALSLRPCNIRLTAPEQVKLSGKGNKERICPIWPETAALLAALLERNPRPENEPLFVNRYGFPISAAGVRYKLAQYVRTATNELPSLRRKRVHPHTFRHTVGVELVSAGVDITVIRSWFGHVSLNTTNRYARANIETKRRALEQMDQATRPRSPPRWRRNPNLLDWLDSL